MEECFRRWVKAVLCHHYLTYRDHLHITDVISSIPAHKLDYLSRLAHRITPLELVVCSACQISDWKEREADLLLWLLSSTAHISGKPFSAVRAVRLQIGRGFDEIATVHLQLTTPTELSYGAPQLQIQLVLAATSSIGFLAKAYSSLELSSSMAPPVMPDNSDQYGPSSGNK